MAEFILRVPVGTKILVQEAENCNCIQLFPQPAPIFTVQLTEEAGAAGTAEPEINNTALEDNLDAEI